MQFLTVNSKEELDNNRNIFLSQGYILKVMVDDYVVLEKPANKTSAGTMVIYFLVCIPALVYFLIKDSGAKGDMVTISIKK